MAVLVQDISPLSVNVGNTVRLSGSGFDGDCSVYVGNVAALVTDYDVDWIEFEAPKTEGSYVVRLMRGGVEAYRTTIEVVGIDNSETWNLPVRGQDEFRNALVGLMPRGFAWHLGKQGNWWKLFTAFAAGFLALHDNFRKLVDESSPFKTTSFAEWEKELGLPIKGLQQSSAAGRKNEIIRIARKKGGCTVPYLKSLLNLYGVRYELFEYWKNPSVFPSWVARREGDNAKFYVLVKVYQDHYTSNGFTCNSKCNAALGGPNDYVMEAILEQAKPAHVKIIYRYFVKILTDMNGTPIVPSDEDQRMIIV